MTSVAEKFRAGRHGIAERWHHAPRWVRWVGIAALIVFFYALPNREFYQWLGPIPTTGSNFGHVLFTVSIYVLLAVGLNIVVGFAGLLDLGYFGFFAVGAYTVAVLTSPSSDLSTLWPWLVALPLALGFTMISGVMLGYADAAAARRLSRHRDARLRRDHPHRRTELGVPARDSAASTRSRTPRAPTATARRSSVCSTRGRTTGWC